jgi:hypothetical protein
VVAQVFTGQIPEYDIRVDQPHTVRSVQFEKATAGSRLRITYRDKARTGPSRNTFRATLELRLDGVALPLLSTDFDAPLFGVAGQFQFFWVASPFTTVGWATSVPAGHHTLDSHYVMSGDNAPIVCFVSGSPYLVEIDEQP